MAYTTINKSTDHFNTKLYTGNGSDGHAISNVGFQPDLVWIKNRASGDHALHDVVRGATKRLKSNNSNAESTLSDGLQSFDSNGFTLGDAGNYNGSSGAYVSWNWKAGGGQGSSNTNGSINTTYTSVNTTAGFSISSYTGTGSAATIGHGLGAVPKMIIAKKRNGSTGWRVYHHGIGATKSLFLDGSEAPATSTAYFNDTSPTSSVFSIGTNSGVNASGDTYIAYCFAEKTGYSKFGSYTGNGNADGTFIYTGFKPSWVMIKRYDNSGESWWMFDSKRSESNVANDGIVANGNNTEYSNNATFKLDFLSNGFKIRNSDGAFNASGGTYIYMSFAEAPLVGSNNVPCTAR